MFFCEYREKLSAVLNQARQDAELLEMQTGDKRAVDIVASIDREVSWLSIRLETSVMQAVCSGRPSGVNQCD